MPAVAAEAKTTLQPRPGSRQDGGSVKTGAAAALARNEKITPADLKLLQSDPSTETRSLFAAKFGRQYDEFAASSTKEFADTILYHLAKDVEAAVRQALAETIAESSDLPKALALELAVDEIEIAGPILERSGALEDPDLIEIVKSQAEHYACAVAGRSSVSEPVTDALIDTGHTGTIVRLLTNQGAAFSNEALHRLAKEFAGDGRIQEHLVKLPDLPPEVVEHLIDGIGEALEWDLIKSRSIDPSEARKLVNAMKGQAAKAMAKQGAVEEMTFAKMQERMVRGLLKPLDILSFLRGGHVSQFEAALAAMAKVDLQRTKRLLYSMDRRALAALCLRAGLGTPQYLAIRMAVDLADMGINEVRAKSVKYPQKTARFVQDQYERIRKDRKLIAQFFSR
ncbi:MAG: DUF2336 domain-containing protein [Alphaproteobacteria bacterium]